VQLWFRRSEDFLRGRRRPTVTDLLDAAELHERDGKPFKALSVWKNVLRLEPKRTDVHERLASLYERMDLRPEAREHLESVAEHYVVLCDADALVRTLERIQVLDSRSPAR
jgi:regulator of sirC expression with transglutaminase-like and TPR domain